MPEVAATKVPYVLSLLYFLFHCKVQFIFFLFLFCISGKRKKFTAQMVVKVTTKGTQVGLLQNHFHALVVMLEKITVEELP